MNGNGHTEDIMNEARATYEAIQIAVADLPLTAFRARYRTFDKFAAAVLGIREESNCGHAMTYARTVLDAAKASHGSVLIRSSYASHLCRHGFDNPLER